MSRIKHKKEMNETIKLGLILFTITAICTGLLGGINSITTPIIATKKETAKQEAMAAVLSEAETFKTVEGINDELITELYIGLKGEQYAGVVAKVSPAGYGGPIDLLVGVNKEGAINGIKILTHTETPGLGANVVNPKFTDQFMNKIPPLKVIKGEAKDDEISAITGSTITSDAVTKGVNHITEYVKLNQAELEKGGSK